MLFLSWGGQPEQKKHLHQHFTESGRSLIRRGRRSYGPGLLLISNFSLRMGEVEDNFYPLYPDEGLLSMYRLMSGIQCMHRWQRTGFMARNGEVLAGYSGLHLNVYIWQRQVLAVFLLWRKQFRYQVAEDHRRKSDWRSIRFQHICITTETIKTR